MSASPFHAPMLVPDCRLTNVALPACCRFTLALVDPCPDVAMLAQHILGDALSSKAPLLAYNHFVEVMFAINDCRQAWHVHEGTPGKLWT